MSRQSVQEDALKIALNHKRCGLAISMGVGKTRIAIQHFQRSYNPFIKALVVIPKLSIKESWLAELQKLDIEDLAGHLTFTTYLSIGKQRLVEKYFEHAQPICCSVFPNRRLGSIKVE